MTNSTKMQYIQRSIKNKSPGTTCTFGSNLITHSNANFPALSSKITIIVFTIALCNDISKESSTAQHFNKNYFFSSLTKKDSTPECTYLQFKKYREKAFFRLFEIFFTFFEIPIDKCIFLVYNSQAIARTARWSSG